MLQKDKMNLLTEAIKSLDDQYKEDIREIRGELAEESHNSDHFSRPEFFIPQVSRKPRPQKFVPLVFR
ncbi:hypothetical protein AXF42_Ash010988 [Apostasia shenzhenica]|uniref:Uncharacterized protein n=1 Tax=Apostasia shenzhenica TaxID=1088818 RepID=A0A2H9ZQT7_9ASPA|nr:hypothetical protein AXF42_Ash010988 [Apostasia shenzhenica]